MPATLSELMETNLRQVWNERDAAIRMNVIKTVYTEDSSLFEMGGEKTGYDDINKVMW